MRKNKKTGNCCWCGTQLTPGTGNLFYVDEEDENLGIGPMGWIGWLVACPDQDACGARKAELRREAVALATRKKQIDNLERRLFSVGEYITSEDGICLDGIVWERPNRGHNIYGGGTQYVVTRAYIWQIQNNGMDGDDWSQNNIRTGGAGAIGYRFDLSLDRMGFLEAHAENMTEKEAKEEEFRLAKEEEEKTRIRAGIAKMLERTDWTTLEAAMEKAGTTKFCPQELTLPSGQASVKLTVSEAKAIMAG